MHPGLTGAEQAQVIDAVKAAVARHLQGSTDGRPTAGVAAT
jgi:hypothetical protein